MDHDLDVRSPSVENVYESVLDHHYEKSALKLAQKDSSPSESSSISDPVFSEGSNVSYSSIVDIRKESTFCQESVGDDNKYMVPFDFKKINASSALTREEVIRIEHTYFSNADELKNN